MWRLFFSLKHYLDQLLFSLLYLVVTGSIHIFILEACIMYRFLELPVASGEMFDWIHRKKYLSIVKWCRWIATNESCYYAKQLNRLLLYSLFVYSCCCSPIVCSDRACMWPNKSTTFIQLHKYNMYMLWLGTFDFVCFVSFFGIFYFISLCSCAFMNESTDKPNTRIKMFVNQRLHEKQKQYKKIKSNEKSTKLYVIVWKWDVRFNVETMYWWKSARVIYNSVNQWCVYAVLNEMWHIEEKRRC